MNARELIAAEGLTICEVYGLQTTTRVFGAYVGPLPVGGLTVDEREGTIELVVVEEGFRRLGIATRLLEEARRLTGLALDTDTGLRSREGSAFARATGIKTGARYRAWSAREARAAGAGLLVGLFGAERDVC